MAGERLLTDSGYVLKPEGIALANVDGRCPECCEPIYVQAKQCHDGAIVDMWRLASDGLPYYFHKAGICYYIDEGNPTSITSGTAVSGETPMASCGVSPCTCANCGGTVPNE